VLAVVKRVTRLVIVSFQLVALIRPCELPNDCRLCSTVCLTYLSARIEARDCDFFPVADLKTRQANVHEYRFPIYNLKRAVDTWCVGCGTFEKVRPPRNYRGGSRAIGRNSLLISRRHDTVCQISETFNGNAMQPVGSINAPLGWLCEERITGQGIYRSAQLKIQRRYYIDRKTA
jgi:hypothetical protein